MMRQESITKFRNWCERNNGKIEKEWLDDPTRPEYTCVHDGGEVVVSLNEDKNTASVEVRSEGGIKSGFAEDKMTADFEWIGPSFEVENVSGFNTTDGQGNDQLMIDTYLSSDGEFDEKRFYVDMGLQHK